MYVYLRGAIDGGDEGMWEWTMDESFEESCVALPPADRDDVGLEFDAVT